MPFCDICGRRLDLGARFCDACGRKLTIEEQPWRHTTPQDLLLPSAAVIHQPGLRTTSFHLPEALFCGICGRELEAGAKFCDACGRELTAEEQIWRHTTPPYLMRPSVAVIQQPIPRTIPAHEMTRATKGRSARKTLESERAEPQAVTHPRVEPPSTVSPRRFHITRRALTLSVAGGAVIVIIAVAFLTGLIVLPPLPGTGTQTSTQTSSQVVITQATGPVLRVNVEITRNTVSPGTTQVIIVTVRDPNGSAVPNAQIRIEVVYPLGQKVDSEGLTGENGQYVHAFFITASADSLGTFNVTVSATKDGYAPGEAQATFQAVQA